MSQRGFTLVELMVVVALIVLLMAWGIPAYSTWNSRQNVEGEIGRLYSDLQFARMTAYSNKNLTGIYWGGGTNITQYSIVTNTNANATSIDTGATQLGATVSAGRFPLTPTPIQKSVSFDGRGLLYTGDANDPATQVIFYITPNYGAGTNCVAVSLTSIVSGKWDGTNCNP
ncbi:MAG: GspH/FimT family pseudopilin [Syntrophobacteraceae bacterium]